MQCAESGWRDLNPRPLVPQTSALTKLRYSPYHAEPNGTVRLHAKTYTEQDHRLTA